MNEEVKFAAFEECLQRLLSGESLEQVLAAYPQWSVEFRPMLEAALIARHLGDNLQAPKAAMARSRARFLSEAQSRARPRLAFPLLRFPSLARSLAILVLIAALVFGAASTAGVSAEALPGDPLYPMKLLAERTRLLLTKAPTSRLELEKQFDQERAEEVNELIKRSRTTMVNFVGGLLEMQGNEWQVEDIRVEITPGTQIVGDIRVGYHVGVQGVLQADGRVIASRVWSREFDIVGILQQMTPEQWVVSGVPFSITSETIVQGKALVGSRVSVHAVLLLDESLQARLVQVLAPPAPKPTQTLRPTREPKATPTPEISGDHDEGDKTPEYSKTPKPSKTPNPTKTPEPTREGEHEKTPEPSKTPKPSETPKPTKTPEPTHEGERGETPRPTETPKPTDHD